MTVREPTEPNEQTHQMQRYMTQQEADARIGMWYRWVLSLSRTSTQQTFDESRNTETLTMGFAGTLTDESEAPAYEHPHPVTA